MNEAIKKFSLINKYWVILEGSVTFEKKPAVPTYLLILVSSTARFIFLPSFVLGYIYLVVDFSCFGQSLSLV